MFNPQMLSLLNQAVKAIHQGGADDGQPKN
jgi:hypothetical protein